MKNNWLSGGNPCKRDCPERKPGCNCEKRIEWKQAVAERKEIVKEARKKHADIEAVLHDRRGGKN